MRVEEFPDRDRVRPDALGPLVKLPLGVHGRTGRRCPLLDDEGKPLEDPFEAIRAVPWLSPETITPAPAAPVGITESRGPEAQAAFGPRALRMLEGCRILGYLSDKATRTSYLNHRERLSLLCSLGHLGEEGRAALHTIISRTYNYRREVTDRHFERLPPWPISCPKLREMHPEAVAAGPCKCEFSLRGRAYPTPLLHSLKASEIPAFQKPHRPETTASRETPGQELNRGAEEKLKKIAELKRHRRGIESSIERLQSELAALLGTSGGDSLELSIGVLRRVKRSEGPGWDLLVEV